MNDTRLIILYLDEILRTSRPHTGSIRSGLSINFYEYLSKNKELTQTINDTVNRITNTKLYQMLAHVDDA